MVIKDDFPMSMKSALLKSVLFASFALSQSTYAAWQLPVSSSNFLLGVQAGYERQKEQFTTRYAAPFTGVPGIAVPVFLNEHSETISDNGIPLGVLAGWQARCDRFMFGFEVDVEFGGYFEPRSFVFGDIPTAIDDDVLLRIENSATAFFDRGPAWDITARFGYFVTPGFMPYIRAGARVSNVEVNYQVFTYPTLPFGIFASDFSSESRTIWGVVAGFGAEFPTFIGASTLRFEYLFTRSDRILIDDSTLPIVGTHKFRYPETHELRLQWVYNFV